MPENPYLTANMETYDLEKFVKSITGLGLAEVFEKTRREVIRIDGIYMVSKNLPYGFGSYQRPHRRFLFLFTKYDHTINNGKRRYAFI
jgi:hypothetical protein